MVVNWAKENPQEAAARQKVAEILQAERLAAQLLKQQESLLRSQQAIQEQDINRQNSKQKLAEQENQIAQEPSKFLQFIGELDQAELLPGEIPLDARRHGLAAAVVLANRLGDVPVPKRAYEQSVEILTKYLKDTLLNAKPTDSGVTIPQPYELQRVLADIIPDRFALDKWIEKYPVILQETSGNYGGFIGRWQDDVIRRNLLSEATPEERGLAKKFVEAGVTQLGFEAGQEGRPGYVGYSSKEDMLADIKSYFMVRDEEESHPYGWYRTTKEVFEDDLVYALVAFVESSKQILDSGTPLTFKVPKPQDTILSRNDGLYVDQNNFIDHAISIQVEKDSKGNIAYKLMLGGGRQGLANVQGRLIDSFAAYVGRKVEFDDSSKVMIVPDYQAEYGWEIRSLESHPEKLKELLSGIENNGIQPVTKRHDNTSSSGTPYYSQEQTWSLPQKLTRYAELKGLLDEWFGQSVTAEYRDKNDAIDASVDPERGLEPRTILYLRETFDEDGEKIFFQNGKAVPDNNAYRRYQADEIGLKNFVVATTPAQVESMRRIANHMLFRKS